MNKNTKQIGNEAVNNRNTHILIKRYYNVSVHKKIIIIERALHSVSKREEESIEGRVGSSKRMFSEWL